MQFVLTQFVMNIIKHASSNALLLDFKPRDPPKRRLKTASERITFILTHFLKLCVS